MKHCDFYFFETLRNVFQKHSGRCFYQTLQNVSNKKKFQCFTETSNPSLSKKDLAFFFHERLQYLSNIKKCLFSQLQIATSLYCKDSAIFNLKIAFSL